MLAPCHASTSRGRKRARHQAGASTDAGLSRTGSIIAMPTLTDAPRSSGVPTVVHRLNYTLVISTN